MVGMATPPEMTSAPAHSADAKSTAVDRTVETAFEGGPVAPIAARTKRQKITRYLLNTVLSFGVSVGVTALLHEGWGVDEAVAYGVALVIAFVVNFLMFRYYVFDGRTDRPGRQLAVFAGSSVAFRLTEWLGFRLLTEGLGVYYLAAVVLMQGGTFVLKYFVYGRWLFKRRSARSTPKTIA